VPLKATRQFLLQVWQRNFDIEWRYLKCRRRNNLGMADDLYLRHFSSHIVHLSLFKSSWCEENVDRLECEPQFLCEFFPQTVMCTFKPRCADVYIRRDVPNVTEYQKPTKLSSSLMTKRAEWSRKSSQQWEGKFLLGKCPSSIVI
jgi:hypothetical protein